MLKGEIGRVVRGVIEHKQDQFQGLVTSTYIQMVYSREHGLPGLGEGCGIGISVTVLVSSEFARFIQ